MITLENVIDFIGPFTIGMLVNSLIREYAGRRRRKHDFVGRLRQD